MSTIARSLNSVVSKVIGIPKELLKKSINFSKGALKIGAGVGVGIVVARGVANLVNNAKRNNEDGEEFKLKKLHMDSLVKAGQLECEVKSVAFHDAIHAFEVECKVEGKIKTKTVEEQNKTFRHLLSNSDFAKYFVERLKKEDELVLEKREASLVKIEKEEEARLREEEDKIFLTLQKGFKEIMSIDYLTQVLTDNYSFCGICDSQTCDFVCDGEEYSISTSIIKCIARSQVRKRNLIFLSDEMTVFAVDDDKPIVLNFWQNGFLKPFSFGKNLTMIKGLSTEEGFVFVRDLGIFIQEKKKLFLNQCATKEVESFLKLFEKRFDFNKEGNKAINVIDIAGEKNFVNVSSWEECEIVKNKITFGNVNFSSYVHLYSIFVRDKLNEMVNYCYLANINKEVFIQEEIFFVFYPRKHEKSIDGYKILKYFFIASPEEMQGPVMNNDFKNCSPLVLVDLPPKLLNTEGGICFQVIKKGYCWNEIKKSGYMAFYFPINNVKIELFSVRRLEILNPLA